MNVRPLTGQVMVYVLPPPKETGSGLALPDQMPLSPERVQERDHNPVKPPALFAKVEAIGPWSIINGRYHPPAFKVGDKVAITNGAGKQLSWGTNTRLRMVSADEVLAVVD